MGTGTRWAIIGRGFAGWHAESTCGKVSSSGGFVQPYTYAGTPCAGYAAEAIDGALIYDAENADRDEFTRLIFSGPILDCGLPAGTVQAPYGEPEPYNAETHKIGGGIGLHHFALDVYAALLRDVPGVRFGTITQGVVTWEPDPSTAADLAVYIESCNQLDRTDSPSKPELSRLARRIKNHDYSEGTEATR